MTDEKPKKKRIIKKKSPASSFVLNSATVTPVITYTTGANTIPTTTAYVAGGFTQAFGNSRQDIDLKHGSLSTYNNHKCRCVKCREAMRAYRAAYREKYKGIPKVSRTKTKRAYEL